MNFSESDVRSFPCNGQLIKNIRETLGLTQMDFAKRAGYSVRLIGKAEAGNPVSRITIEVLAEALSNNTKKWRPDDLIFNPTSVVQDCLQAKISGPESLVLNFRNQISPNVEARVRSGFKLTNLANQYSGFNGLIEYYRTFHSICELSAPSEIQKLKLFRSQNDFVAWDERQWTVLKCESKIFITTRFVFVNNVLVCVEDRIQKANSTSPNPMNGEPLNGKQV